MFIIWIYWIYTLFHLLSEQYWNLKHLLCIIGVPVGTFQGVASLQHHPTPSTSMSEPQSLQSMEPEQLNSLTGESFAALNKNPISALMEWAQQRKMTATIETVGQMGPSHRPKYVCRELFSPGSSSEKCQVIEDTLYFRGSWPS